MALDFTNDSREYTSSGVDGIFTSVGILPVPFLFLPPVSLSGSFFVRRFLRSSNWSELQDGFVLDGKKAYKVKRQREEARRRMKGFHLGGDRNPLRGHAGLFPVERNKFAVVPAQPNAGDSVRVRRRCAPTRQNRDRSVKPRDDRKNTNEDSGKQDKKKNKNRTGRTLR
ncbi:hypothetical protein RUM43_008919 [Polyplax serrata]|uniref:Uncharacterized protein n=1 Tax=Polyplax serrata TaxID=468196 RepID=A0AAN8NV40_POLSC